MEPKEKKPLLTEKSSANSYLYSPSQFEPFNPDFLYQKKANYDIYDEMRIDDQIKSILLTKKTLMLNAGWEIVWKNEPNEEVEDFIMKALTEDIEIDFNQSLEEILTALDYGFSITEVIWKIEEAKIKLKYLKTRAPHSFELVTDQKGNLKKILQNQDKIQVPLEPKKFLIFTNRAEFGNWYGTSDCQAAYKAWWSKEFIAKCWNIYLERFGMPTAIGTYEAGTTSTPDIEKLQQILKNIQTKTAITIPKEIEIAFLEATRSGDSGYEKAIDSYNTMIARSMLMPDLMGLSGSQTSGGSFALGKTQTDTFFMTLEWTRKQLESRINRKIIQPLVNYNFNVDEMPRFQFKAIDEGDKAAQVKTWSDMISKVKVKPTEDEVNWARSLIGAPEGDVELESDVQPVDTSKPVTKTPKEDIKSEDEKQMALETKKPIMAEKKINYKEIKNNIVELETRWIGTIGNTIKTIEASLIETVKKGKYIENKRLDKVTSLTLKHTNRLRLDFKAMFKEVFKLGINDAKNVVSATKEMIDLPPQELTDFIIDDMPAFSADLITDDILKKAKLTLSNGITAGTSGIAIRKQLSDIFQDYDQTYTKNRLETIVRTNTAKVYNDANQIYFQPLVDSGEIQAYQYSAILDDRTTDFCNDHHGQIYSAKDGFIAEAEPPNHFNALLEGSIIKTNDGNKKIEDIIVGDYVISHKNRLCEVYDVMSKFDYKNYYEIKLDNGSLINITAEHPVLTNKGWKRTDELTLSDNVICFEDIYNG